MTSTSPVEPCNHHGKGDVSVEKNAVHPVDSSKRCEDWRDDNEHVEDAHIYAICPWEPNLIAWRMAWRMEPSYTDARKAPFQGRYRRDSVAHQAKPSPPIAGNAMHQAAVDGISTGVEGGSNANAIELNP